MRISGDFENCLRNPGNLMGILGISRNSWGFHVSDMPGALGLVLNYVIL